jgi:hypothetical protein
MKDSKVPGGIQPTGVRGKWFKVIDHSHLLLMNLLTVLALCFDVNTYCGILNFN